MTMSHKLTCLVVLVVMAMGGHAEPLGTDPNAPEIDRPAFKSWWMLSSDEVEERVKEADSVPLRSSLRCEDGPVIDVLREPGIFYWPAPEFKRCRGLPCPKKENCEPQKTITRNFWTIRFKEFFCFGIKIWIPVGIQYLCLTDEIECQCKPDCPPIFCFPPRQFNSKECKCECPPQKCKKPFELDPSSCQCRCPKDIVCKKPAVLNFKTCECECPNKCPPGYRPDPDNNCTCVCECDRKCPKGSTFQCKGCKCVGDCERFYSSEYDCNQVDSCEEYPDQSCRWFPTFPRNPCQCECCQPKNPKSNFDCGSYTPWGEFVCNYWWDYQTNTRPCQWVCTSEPQ